MTPPADDRRTPGSLEALIAQWRAKAKEARQWAEECAHWDGANRHEMRNRAGVYDTCADELATVLRREGLDAETETRLREFLWRGHGHTHQYGDDGEMQCGECIRVGTPPFVIDYKRAPLADAIRQ